MRVKIKEKHSLLVERFVVIKNTYTADGKKLSRTTNGVLAYYVYDGNIVIEEQDENSEQIARNVYGRNLITRETSDGIVVYAYNGHSDVVAICNIDGDALVTYEYDEFGNVTVETVVDEEFANFDNPYRYAGYEYIEEVKLYDLNARYYNPEIARFLSADPYYNLGNRIIGLYEINVPNAWSIIQANNLFAYCGNDPVLYIDNTGEWLHLVIGAVVGAVISGVTSAVYQYKTTGKIDAAKTAIAMVGGAVSGTLAASGAGIVAQVAGNAAIGAIQNVAEQTYEINNGSKSQYDLIDIGLSATVGGTAGYVGGSSNVSGIKSVSNQTVKRIGNAITYHIGNGSTHEISNALVYFYKSSSKLIGKEIIKGIVKAAGVDVANKIISETQLDNQFKEEMKVWVSGN